MDGRTFDGLARALNAGVSRRRGLLAGLAAAVAALAEATTEAAPGPACKPNRMECKGPGECCSGACRNGWCAPANGRGRGKPDRSKGKGGNGGNGRNNGKGGGKPKPKPACTPYGDACAADGDCCVGMFCDAGACTVDCAATLGDAGCEFLSGPGVWNCGSQDLSGVNLSGCDLTNASFFNTDATGAIFAAANLTGANFFDAIVTDAVWDGTTCPGGANSDANGGTCCGQFINNQAPAGCPDPCAGLGAAAC